MIVYLIRNDIPLDFLVRAIERQKVTSRARGYSGTCQKIGAPFSEPAPPGEPRVHICCSNPGRVDAYTRVAEYTRHVVRVLLPSCGPDLTKSGQMSILNVVQVGAVCRRKLTRCIRASRVYNIHACVRVRACPHTRPRPDSLFTDCTCFTGGIAYQLLIFVVARVSNLHMVSVNVGITNGKNERRKNLLRFLCHVSKYWTINYSENYYYIICHQ